MDRKIIATGAFFGMSGIIFGAFGAHSLSEVLDAHQLGIFETGVRYQMYHAFLLLFVGFGTGISPKKRNWIYWLTVIGTIFFSGSIYLLATNNLNHLNTKIIGPITPIGGLLLIVAWFLLFIDFLRKKS